MYGSQCDHRNFEIRLIDFQDYEYEERITNMKSLQPRGLGDNRKILTCRCGVGGSAIDWGINITLKSPLSAAFDKGIGIRLRDSRQVYSFWRFSSTPIKNIILSNARTRATG
jgi:hypothetical protein